MLDCQLIAWSFAVNAFGKERARMRRSYFRDLLIPITIESGPTSGSTRVDENPASRIQPEQSAPV